MAKSPIRALTEQAQKYSLQGNRALAAETYRKIFLEEPTNPRWPQKAGEEYRTVGQKDMAVAAFQSAARLYAEQGFTLKALTLCKLVLDMDPANPAAQEILVNCSAPATAAPPVPVQSKPHEPTAPPAVVEPVGPVVNPAVFSIPPGEALEAVHLSHSMKTAGPPAIPDLEAIAILIDEPESTPAEASAVSPREAILARLPPVAIFSSLNRSTLRALVERVDVRTFAPGARIITQGEAGHSLFVLVDGEVAVFHEGPPRVELRHLKEGAFFGEIALVAKVSRTVTVEAFRECQVLEISREMFNELIQGHPEMVAVILRYLRERLVNGLVETHPLFAPFVGAVRADLVRRFSLLEVARDCALAEAGARASAMYILLCGEAESRRGDVRSAGFTTGTIFGVESLLTGRPSTVSVRTLTKCWILKMREDIFREVILTHSPVLATLSDLIADQVSRADAVGGRAAPRLVIPIV